MDKILVFVEAKGDGPRKVSLELLSEGLKLVGSGQFSMEAVFLGKLSGTVKEKILNYTEKLIHVTDPVLENYTAEGYAMALAGYARETGAKMILAGATQRARDFLPRVAVLLQTGIASDVTGARWNADPMTFIRPMYGGRVLAEVSFSAYPAIVTARPNSFGVGAPLTQKGEFAEFQAGIPPEQVKTSVIKTEETTLGKVDLTEADLIVAGGRGIESRREFPAHRRVGPDYRRHRGGNEVRCGCQVAGPGRPGRQKRGKPFLRNSIWGAGISGAIHHIMGMDTAKVVLAINNDPHAIIFNYANYGIVGDLFEVLPAMTEELRNRLGK